VASGGAGVEALETAARDAAAAAAASRAAAELAFDVAALCAYNSAALVADAAARLHSLAALDATGRVAAGDADAAAALRGALAASGAFASLLPPPLPRPAPGARSRAEQEVFEGSFFRGVGLVAALGYWEASRLAQVCRELRFGFSGGGAAADLIRDGLARTHAWGALRALRAAFAQDGRDRGRVHLQRASEAGDEQLVCELLALGAPAELRLGNSFTALMLASDRGREGVVRALLAHGADANAASAFGDTALILACARGHEGVARRLVRAGARVGARNDFGGTPKSEARRGGFAGIERMLAEAGAQEQSQVADRLN